MEGQASEGFGLVGAVSEGVQAADDAIRWREQGWLRLTTEIRPGDRGGAGRIGVKNGFGSRFGPDGECYVVYFKGPTQQAKCMGDEYFGIQTPGFCNQALGITLGLASALFTGQGELCGLLSWNTRARHVNAPPVHPQNPPIARAPDGNRIDSMFNISSIKHRINRFAESGLPTQPLG